MDKMRFRPVKGQENTILNLTPEPGKLYFATDTRKIYLADGDNFLPMGGGGISVLYASDGNVRDGLDDTYYIAIDTLEDENASPKRGDLIINQDGKFYKIINISENEIRCSLIAVFGTGGGGSGSGPSGPGSTAKITIKPIVTPAV